MKVLKYFMWLYVIFFLLSGPTLILFSYKHVLIHGIIITEEFWIVYLLGSSLFIYLIYFLYHKTGFFLGLALIFFLLGIMCIDMYIEERFEITSHHKILFFIIFIWCGVVGYTENSLFNWITFLILLGELLLHHEHLNRHFFWSPMKSSSLGIILIIFSYKVKVSLSKTTQVIGCLYIFMTFVDMPTNGYKIIWIILIGILMMYIGFKRINNIFKCFGVLFLIVGIRLIIEKIFVWLLEIFVWMLNYFIFQNL